MSRIRSIHPAILTDEAFMTLTVECPLAIALLVGLWMEADDAGVFEWKPLTIKARILPAAPTDIGGLLDALTENNFVRSFEVGGRQYGVVRNFVRFQRPKEPKDTHPETEEMREYAGFENGKRPHSGIGRPSATPTSEPLPNHFRSPSEIGPQMEEEGGRRKDEELTPSPESVPASARGGGGIFDEFWKGYPKSPSSSPRRAREAFGELTDDDQRMAIDYLPAFKLAKTTHPMNPERYIRERIFDNLALGPRIVSSTVQVQRDSPEGEAWDKAWRTIKGKSPPWTNGTWRFPSKFPPDPLTEHPPPSSMTCVSPQSNI